MPDHILFDPKKITVTPEVRGKLAELDDNITDFLRRHIRGDRGEVSGKELVEPLEDSDVMRSVFQLSDGTKMRIRTNSDLETTVTLHYEDQSNAETEEEST